MRFIGAFVALVAASEQAHAYWILNPFIPLDKVQQIIDRKTYYYLERDDGSVECVDEDEVVVDINICKGLPYPDSEDHPVLEDEPNNQFKTAAKNWCNNVYDGSYGSISEWNTSLVTDMSGAFRGCTNFNEDISKWDVSQVTNMESMFYKANEFNGGLSTWNVSQVTNMKYMFGFAFTFNGTISKWDVSKVTDMKFMFYECSEFNGNLLSWNVSKVKSMHGMFTGASDFNSNYTAFWDTSAFSGAFDFEQPCPSGLMAMSGVRGNVTTRCEGYDDSPCYENPNICHPIGIPCISGHIDAVGRAINGHPVTCIEGPLAVQNDQFKKEASSWCNHDHVYNGGDKSDSSVKMVHDSLVRLIAALIC